jgi:hypothetical protein
MPGVVLHVTGPDFDPGPLLAGLGLEPFAVFRRGDPCFPESRSDRRHTVGGFKCDVSAADGVIADEVRDAIDFLTRHHGDLEAVSRHPAVEDICLDFGHYLRIDGRRVAVQCDILPPELLRLAGELGIGIMLSLYPTPSESGGN